jgi:hypothetical protein
MITNPARPHQPGFAFLDQAIGIAVYMTICISVNAFVFYAASCVFVSPKNLLALPPVGGEGLEDLRNLVFLKPRPGYRLNAF